MTGARAVTRSVPCAAVRSNSRSCGDYVAERGAVSRCIPALAVRSSPGPCAAVRAVVTAMALRRPQPLANGERRRKNADHLRKKEVKEARNVTATTTNDGTKLGEQRHSD